jgi:hypothetical protein
MTGTQGICFPPFLKTPKEAVDPGLVGANKTPAIRAKAIHRITDNKGEARGNKRHRPRSNTLRNARLVYLYGVPNALVLFGKQLKKLRLSRDLS